MKRLKPEKPGVCQDCGRKLTQGSPSCVRCGDCEECFRLCSDYEYNWESKNTE
jgi:hypothetical protein